MNIPHICTVYLHCKVSKGKVESLISSSTNQNGDIKSDLVGWVKAKIQSPLHAGDSNSFSYRSSANKFCIMVLENRFGADQNMNYDLNKLTFPSFSLSHRKLLLVKTI
jgi:hypothetical protein